MLKFFLLTSPLAQAAVVLLIGYLLGSIPFGLLLTKAAGLGDVRAIGSGNIGATNVLRTGNKKLALATLILDALKGALAALIGLWIGRTIGAELLELVQPAPVGPRGEPVIMAIQQLQLQQFVHRFGFIAGLGALLGHVFPVWLGFRGGKGVATYIGALFVASWPAGVVFAGVWLLTAYLTRFSSLAALLATVAVFLYLIATGGPFVGSVVAFISALLFWTHRENIARLLNGTEGKIGEKSSKPAEPVA